MALTVSAVIVTHNSEAFIGRCLQYLEKQSRPLDQVIIVDCKSRDKEALLASVRSVRLPFVLLELEHNAGYAGACNAAAQHLSGTCDYVLYVGPDTYLDDGYVASAIAFMEDPTNRSVGALSGKLLGFDNHTGQPTGLIDSTGIEQTWYGRWYDRGQGKPESVEAEHWSPVVRALCGTALFCRRTALAKLEATEPNTIYDASLFLYKEDIDLSLRLVAAGFDLRYHSEMVGYHCRGWKRARMSRMARILSARNEAVINAQLSPVKYLYSCIKLYLALRGF